MSYYGGLTIERRETLLQVSVHDTEIDFGTWEHMLLPPKKNILPCQKIRTKNWHLHFDVLCANDKFHEKPMFAVALTKNCHFTHYQKNIGF